MNPTKLKIDLSQGAIEVEGEEEFVKSVYTDFKEKIKSNVPLSENSSNKEDGMTIESPNTSNGAKKNPPKSKATQKRKSRGSSPSIINNLDLSGGSKCEKLRDFYKRYETKSNYERNLIFIYYLQQMLKITGITVNHVFTCYRNVSGLKVPEALYQSLSETSNKKGWVDTSDTDNIKVTVSGMNHLEHDMSKKLNQD